MSVPRANRRIDIVVSPLSLLRPVVAVRAVRCGDPMTGELITPVRPLVLLSAMLLPSKALSVMSGAPGKAAA